MGLQQLGDRLVRFVGGNTGMWRVLAVRLVQGDGLPQAERVAVCRGDEPSPLEPQWTLSGVISNIRYVERPEQQELTLKQAPLSRSEATRAALIPIRKTAAWWNLTQEERRSVFENNPITSPKEYGICRRSHGSSIIAAILASLLIF